MQVLFCLCKVWFRFGNKIFWFLSFKKLRWLLFDPSFIPIRLFNQLLHNFGGLGLLSLLFPYFFCLNSVQIVPSLDLIFFKGRKSWKFFILGQRWIDNLFGVLFWKFFKVFLYFFLATKISVISVLKVFCFLSLLIIVVLSSWWVIIFIRDKLKHIVWLWKLEIKVTELLCLVWLPPLVLFLFDKISPLLVQKVLVIFKIQF